GKAVGSVICDSVPMLSRFLGRTMSDPKAPKDVRITVQPGASEDRTKAVYDACKAAGFRNIRADARDESRDIGIRIKEAPAWRFRGAGQEFKILGEQLDKEKMLRDVHKHLGERMNEDLLKEVLRDVEQALRDSKIQKEDAIRALEDARKHLEQLKDL